MFTKKKNILLLALFIMVAGMSVGYAALSQILSINGTANISSEWNVKISGITEKSLVGATAQVPVVSPDSLTATFVVDLQYPGATAVYEINVQNAGTINAKLNSVSGVEDANASEPTGVTYTIDAQANDLLASGQTKNYTVTVNWDSNDTSIPSVKSKTAIITLNYVQEQ
jgi:hypothetical protein